VGSLSLLGDVRRYRFVQVDVFTRRPFGGNQLAVFTDGTGLSDSEMQAIAGEMNYSESTFVLPPTDPAADARMRIFTPGMELPFAGHPTVGTGYVLGLERGRDTLQLELGVGTLRVDADAGDGRVGSAWMEQPLPTFQSVGADRGVLAALLDLETADVSSELAAEIGSAGVPFLYLPLRSLDAVRRARGNLTAMQRFFAGEGHPAIYLFTLETESSDASAHGRMLSLALGESVREDPATGGASGPFGAYLVRHGLRPAGRLLLEQGYEMGRPSQIEVEVEQQGREISGVRVGGGVVRMAEGELFL
jgi:trans-2,3-dihydro-3-hydroxyanthranilate isomerase